MSNSASKTAKKDTKMSENIQKIGEKPLVRRVIKRDGSVVDFDISKIESAIERAMKAAEEGSLEEAKLVAQKVYAELVRITKRYKSFVPSVEGIQDAIEKELMLSDYVNTAKAYILYRQEHAEKRAKKQIVLPDHVAKLANESKKYFRNALGEFVYYRSYARWIEEENRRETWVETVDRFVDFMKENVGSKLSEKEYKEVREAILNQEAVPSMRLMQFAGPAARRTNVCAYNCSYIAPEEWRDFAEVMYISMCGTGVGYSVETKNIQKLPIIQKQTGEKLDTYVVPDSKEGWADALTLGMETWASGKDIDFDFSELRPAGARLKVMGGKSSGPDPLRRLLSFTRDKMLTRQGKRLRNIDAHDILCMIGNCVVAGGVRRSAMISLSDLDDDQVRDAKAGEFWNTNPHRSLANNSAVYESKPSVEEFMGEWLALVKSGTGERGIFNRGSLVSQLPKRRLDQFGNESTPDWGTNPCGEIILQSKQFCNLSEVIARKEDTEKSLLKKVRVATILGTYQASLTHFPYLSKKWAENCRKEALLGVSITGQWDCEAARDPKVLQKMKKEAVRVNKIYAKKMGINPSTAITCVKPSGTVSQMVDASSGTHPRHAKYYIRRIRISATDSLFRMLRDQGIPYHPEVGQSMETANTYVLEFPVAAPNATNVFKDDVSAIEQLEHWKNIKVNYTEHNPSTTISVGSGEWLEVANWVYENWDIVGGLSFLPRTDHVYQLAPFEAITKSQYEELVKKFENVDFSMILAYEQEDGTDVKKELACVGGNCEI